MHKGSFKRGVNEQMFLFFKIAGMNLSCSFCVGVDIIEQFRILIKPNVSQTYLLGRC